MITYVSQGQEDLGQAHGCYSTMRSRALLESPQLKSDAQEKPPQEADWEVQQHQPNYS